MEPKSEVYRKVKSKTEQIVETLTKMIVEGKPEKENMTLSEKNLCNKLGISRSILREAMKILATKGLVSIRQGSGTSIAVLNENIAIEAINNFLK